MLLHMEAILITYGQQIEQHESFPTVVVSIEESDNDPPDNREE